MLCRFNIYPNDSDDSLNSQSPSPKSDKGQKGDLAATLNAAELSHFVDELGSDKSPSPSNQYDNGLANEMKKSKDSPKKKIRGTHDDKQKKASDQQALVNDPDVTLEDLEDELKKLRENGAKEADAASQKAMARAQANIKDLKPADALEIGAKAAEDVEKQFREREQIIGMQMDAIKDNIRVSDAAHQAGEDLVRDHPDALTSEVLNAQTKAAKDEQDRIDNEKKDDRAIKEQAQKEYEKAKHNGAFHSEAANIAEKTKEDLQLKTGTVTPFNAPSDDSFLGLSLDDKIAWQNGFLGPQMHPDDFVRKDEVYEGPVIIPEDGKTVDDYKTNDDFQLGLDAKSAAEDFIKKAVKTDRFPLKDFINDAMELKKNGSSGPDVWNTINKYFKPSDNNDLSPEMGMVNKAFNGLQDSFPLFGPDLIDQGLQNAEPQSKLIQTLAQNNIGQQFGLTPTERQDLVKKGLSEDEIQSINNDIITTNRLTNPDLLKHTEKEIMSGSLRNEMIENRVKMLRESRLDPSTENLDERMIRNQTTKRQLGLQEEPYLSQEAQDVGNTMYEDVFNKTGDETQANEAAVNAAIATQNFLDEGQAYKQSKNASADILEAVRVIEDQKGYVNDKDAKMINQSEKVMIYEPAMVAAQNAKEEAKIAETIEESIKLLEEKAAQHYAIAESHAIESNYKDRKAQQLEKLRHAQDVIQTDEALEQGNDERITNLGIVQVIDDDASRFPLEDASVKFPLKSFGEVEAQNPEELKTFQAQEALKDDLRNKVTENNFDSPLNVVSTPDGFLNMGENATGLQIDSGEVIFPHAAYKEMQQAGMDVTPLTQRINNGEITTSAQGIPYYSAKVEGGKMDLPRPLDATPPKIITNADGSQINTAYAESLNIDKGAVILEPMSSYKNKIRPKIQKPMNVEKRLPLAQQHALEQLEKQGQILEQTEAKVFVNQDGTEIVQLTKPFGESVTMSSEKAMAQDEGIFVEKDIISLDVAEINDTEKNLSENLKQVINNALQSGVIDDPLEMKEMLQESGEEGAEELIERIDQQNGFEGMEQTVVQEGGNGGGMYGSAQSGGMEQSGGGMMTESGGMMTESGGMSQSGGGMMTESGGMMTESGGMSQSGGGMSQSGGGMEQSGGMSQSGGGMMQQSGGMSQSGGGMSQSGGGMSQSGGGYSQSGGMSQSGGGMSQSGGGGSMTTHTHTHTTVVNGAPTNSQTSGNTTTITYGNQPPQSASKPHPANQKINVTETKKPDENTTLKRSLSFDNNAPVGSVKKKFKPENTIPGLSKEASKALKDLDDNADNYEKKHNLEPGTLAKSVDKLPLKVIQEFETNMKNYGEGDKTLPHELQDPKKPYTMQPNYKPDTSPDNSVMNKENVHDPNLPLNHPKNVINKPNQHTKSLDTIASKVGHHKVHQVEDAIYDAMKKYNGKPNPKNIDRRGAREEINRVNILPNGNTQLVVGKKDNSKKKLPDDIAKKVGTKGTDDDGKECIYGPSGECMPPQKYRENHIQVNRKNLNPTNPPVGAGGQNTTPYLQINTKDPISIQEVPSKTPIREIKVNNGQP